MSTKSTAKMTDNNKPKVAFWPQMQSLLNTINHIFILLVGVYITLLARSLNFQDTAMHMFLTVVGVSSKRGNSVMCLVKSNQMNTS